MLAVQARSYGFPVGRRTQAIIIPSCILLFQIRPPTTGRMEDTKLYCLVRLRWARPGPVCGHGVDARGAIAYGISGGVTMRDILPWPVDFAGWVWIGQVAFGGIGIEFDVLLPLGLRL